jgi:hypothetical protein
MRRSLPGKEVGFCRRRGHTAVDELRNRAGRIGRFLGHESARKKRFQKQLTTEQPMRHVNRWTCLIALFALAACQTGPGEEISSTKPYADLIGATYRVIGDLYAYGVYGSLNNRTVRYIDLVPHSDVSGPEYAFRRKVREGGVIKILSAWQEFILFESGIYYVVALEESDLPKGIPVRVALRRDNQGAGADLNPAIYRRLSRGN